MGFGDCRRIAVIVAFTLLPATGATMAGCEAGSVSTFQRSFTSTVTLSAEHLLTVDVPVSVEVLGAPLAPSIFAELTFAITASTATKARTLAEAVELSVTRPSTEEVALTLAFPAEARLTSGLLKLRVPSVLDLRVGSTGSIIVRGMERAISAAASGSIRVEDAQEDVSAQAGSGNVLLDARLPQGARLTGSTGRGDIELRLVDRPSVALDVRVGQGEIVVAHPGLPPAILPTSYQATANGGLATAQLLTQAGRVVIRAR